MWRNCAILGSFSFVHSIFYAISSLLLLLVLFVFASIWFDSIRFCVCIYRCDYTLWLFVASLFLKCKQFICIFVAIYCDFYSIIVDRTDEYHRAKAKKIREKNGSNKKKKQNNNYSSIHQMRKIWLCEEMQMFVQLSLFGMLCCIDAIFPLRFTIIPFHLHPSKSSQSFTKH